jgi:phosphoribosyl 1,2-cyclic phosphate phosphodiesterase
MAQAIDIYADADTLEFLRRVYAHIFADDVDRSVSFIALLRPRLIEPGRPVDLHGLRFTPLRLWHGDTAVLGYRIEALDGAGQVAREQPSPLPLAYCTDVSRIPAETWPRLESLRTLFLGMLRHTPHPKHFSVTEAVEAARRVGARRTWFVHMNHEISHADVDASLPEGMALGYDGLSVR